MNKLLRTLLLLGVTVMTAMSANAQYYSTDRRYSYDRSRYRHTSSYGDVCEVRLNRAGELEEQMAPDMFDRVRLLVVDGPLNGTDFKFLQKLLKRNRCVDDEGRSVDNYVDLDLARALIVGGGDSYYSYYRTAHDEVGQSMFYSCNRLRSVVLPERVRVIADDAFRYCGNLEEVIMPPTVRALGNGAFYSCSDLSRIFLPDGVESIGKDCFEDCTSLKEMDLPPALRTIGDDAFANTRLTQVRLPSRLQSLGNGAFAKTNIRSLFIPAATQIAGNALGRMAYLENIEVENGSDFYTCENGALYDRDGTTLLYFPQGKGGSFAVPDDVTAIAANAFAANERLTSVDLPASVTDRKSVV